MPLKKYGVLKGKAMNSRMGAGRSPHYQVHLVSGESEFRVAINVKSQLHPSELLYLVDENFHHPLTPTESPVPERRGLRRCACQPTTQTPSTRRSLILPTPLTSALCSAMLRAD